MGLLGSEIKRLGVNLKRRRVPRGPGGGGGGGLALQVRINTGFPRGTPRVDEVVWLRFWCETPRFPPPPLSII